MALSQILTYAETAAARLLAQYRERPRLRALVRELAGEVQEVENALWGMVAQTSIDTAEGVWLDRLGAIVGEAREGATDTDYRKYIRARIAANGSASVVEDVLSVMRAWAGGVLPTLAVIDRFPAGFELQLPSPVTLAELPRLFRLVRAARAAGVGVMLIYQTTADADAFTFSSDATLQASATQGFGDSGNPATGGAFVGADRV
jgi:hypothetical protein